MKIILIFTLCVLGAKSFGLLSVEPEAGVWHSLKGSGWQWELIAGESQSIRLSSINGESFKYDISECLFCSGEDDNCDENGIYTVSLPNNEPAIAVVCHKGAHSQRLRVFAPLRDKSNAVFEVTGDFWVNYEPLDLGLKVTYDRRKADGKVEVLCSTWPSPQK